MAKIEANMYIKVGDGRKTKSWADAWNKQVPLKEYFSRYVLTMW